MKTTSQSKPIRLTLALLAAIALLTAWPLRAQTVVTLGITEPILDATLGTPVAGIIGAGNLKEGDCVKKGDVVIELDKSLEELEVARREVVLEPLKADFEASKY